MGWRMSGKINELVAIITLSAYGMWTHSGLLFPSPRDLPDPGKEPVFPVYSVSPALASPVPGWCVDMLQSAQGRKSPS